MSNKLNKKKKIISLVFLISIVALIAFNLVEQDSLKLNDGKYSSTQEAHVDDLKVEVVIEDKVISKVEIEHSDSLAISDLAVENIPLEIIYSTNPNETAQNIDVVAGATNTSEAIIKALEEILEESKIE